MISVIILTYNEERDLPLCLNSVSWSSDVHVLDSGSTDRTIEIARQFNVNISFNKFESFGQQRNFALDNLSIQNEWILFLDADEVVTGEFHTAALEAIQTKNQQVAGYYCCWKMMLEGKWLKHCDNFPKWQLRLLKKGRVNFKDFGHGQKECDVIGKINYIREPYLHFGFSKGWFHWVERHNKYSSQEAIARISERPPFRNIFSRHGSIRNPALKSWLTTIPCWPFLRFFHAYFLNLGFLEGRPGLVYCLNMGYYEFLIQIKIKELRRNWRQKSQKEIQLPLTIKL